MKSLIFDSGPLINFALNGLLPLLEKLKKEFSGDFLITKEVKEEIIDYPQTVKRYELESLQLNKLFNDRIIKHANLTEEQINQLRKIREEILFIANSTFSSNGKNLHLIEKGEAAALALAKMLGNSSIVIDERTARMLCENPEQLRKLLQKKLHTNITAKRENYAYFKNFKIIRSTELAYIAKKKQLLDLNDKRELEATLYALKYKGCSISDPEIEEIKRISK
jgi:predicted nucleic acid-binding protein